MLLGCLAWVGDQILFQTWQVFLETMHMLKPLTALFHPRMVIQALRSRPRDFGDPSACHSRRYNRPGLARTLSQDFDGAC